MMARALITNGAKKVFILGRRLSVLETAAKSHPGLVPVQCDVTSKPSLQSAVDTITADTGYINLLIVNSGVGGTPNTYSPTSTISELRKRLFDEHSMEDFTHTLAVNVSGAFFTMAAFLELLDAGNRYLGYGDVIAPGVQATQSQIVVTSSIAAFIRGPMTSPSYGGSKAAVMMIAKQASSQLARYGIRVNALAPGCKSPLSYLLKAWLLIL
jgi:NAD(P)-dependent dehydrogenase (short-subunit alcohol dehydrogenase family)